MGTFENKIKSQNELIDLIGKWLERGEEEVENSEEGKTGADESSGTDYTPTPQEGKEGKRTKSAEKEESGTEREPGSEEGQEPETPEDDSDLREDDTGSDEETGFADLVDIKEIIREIVKEIEPHDVYDEDELEEWRRHMVEMPDEALRVALEEIREIKKEKSELEKEVSKINALKETYPELQGILESLENGESLIVALAKEIDFSSLPRPGEEGWDDIRKADEERRQNLLERKQEIERLQAEIKRNEELSRLKFEAYRRKYGLSDEEAKKVVALMDEALNNMIYRKIDERMLDIFTLAVRAPSLLEEARKEGRKEAVKEIAGKIKSQPKPPTGKTQGLPDRPPVRTGQGEGENLDSWARAIGEALSLPRTITKRSKGS